MYPPSPFREPSGQAVIAWQAWLGAQAYTFVGLHLPGFGWYLTGQLTQPLGWDALCYHLPPVDGRFPGPRRGRPDHLERSPVSNTYADHVADYAQAGWSCILPVPPETKSPPHRPGLTEPVALYRYVDARGELLYVGISSDPVRRWEQHVQTSLWARYAAGSYWQWYPDRSSARAAEKAAIRHETPIFNTARPDNGQAVNDRKVAYLRTGRSGLLRRVPCLAVVGEFCVACGPDAAAWLETLGVSA